MEIETSQKQDSKIREFNTSKSTKFIKDMIVSIEKEIEDYLSEFPEDITIENTWDPIRYKLITVPQTKIRLKKLRKLWKTYKQNSDWKKLISELNSFLIEKGVAKKELLEPFNKSKLALITIDFIS